MTGSLALVYPVLAQVLWTFVLILWTGWARITALRSRRVRLSDIALDSDAYPDDVRKIANNMHNQFETPILFYVLCGVATYLGSANFLMTSFAWLYVATRVVHTIIHVTTNRVERRFEAFTLGLVILILMWSGLVGRLLTSWAYS